MNATAPKPSRESTDFPLPTGPDELALRVLREHVASVYAAYNASVFVHFGLGAALGTAMYVHEPRTWILVWMAVHLSLGLFLFLMPRWHSGVPLADTTRWARRHSRTVTAVGAAMASAPMLFISSDDLPVTSVVTVVVIGSCARAMQLLWPLKPALYGYTLPMMLSLITVLAWQGDAMHFFLALFSLGYLLFTLRVGNQQHRLLTDSLVLRFENEALAGQLGRQIAAAERASAEKTRFLATASHDLRQPLHAIALFGAALENELREHHGGRNARQLMRAVNALGNSLDTMLDVSRLDAGVVTPAIGPVPLDALFRSLNHMFAARAEQRQLQLRVHASGLWVRSDAQLLYRMLSNLVDNALKYTVRGGVSVRARTRGDMVWIEVVDTGIGIAPEQQERVFEEYYQVHNPGRDRTQGLGIGLSIVQRLSQLLWHPVQLKSRPGRGSRFRLRLPAATQAEAGVETMPPATGLASPFVTGAMPDPARTIHAPHAARGRILLIDDEAEVREAMTGFFRAHGLTVDTAAGEAEAAELLARPEAREHPFTLLVCDYRLANGDNGLDVGQRLQRRFDLQAPLLLVTGETSPERLQRVRASGVPVLFKPVSAAALLGALAELAPETSPAH
ncbi:MULTISPECIES: hybrid sensor histidine kinase/response regulator [unclassified Variovorax]|uniref:ATP-binding response regulator n=1 Tax=unclassified Variovorax TaxID=663243 RepID=UPI000F7E2CBF|nr:MULTISPECIES: hybrid sensor histidine kinase/response regulator [unclassified Variovorax]RSZ44170.1 hybrid sensor histidine kinase/response regulator [Variovorax sp. 553]RSZ45175.1 hybrid sensor histidine kinase/response regulator [Variovorax sp. 679]